MKESKNSKPASLGPGDLGTEPHPAAYLALKWLRSLGDERLFRIQQVIQANLVVGNKTSEVCAETMRRLMAGEPVSDRYLLGLAWMVREVFTDDD